MKSTYNEPIMQLGKYIAESSNQNFENKFFIVFISEDMSHHEIYKSYKNIDLNENYAEVISPGYDYNELNAFFFLDKPLSEFEDFKFTFNIRYEDNSMIQDIIANSNDQNARTILFNEDFAEEEMTYDLLCGLFPELEKCKGKYIYLGMSIAQ